MQPFKNKEQRKKKRKAICGETDADWRALGRLSFDPRVATATTPSPPSNAGASKASLGEVQPAGGIKSQTD